MKFFKFFMTIAGDSLCGSSIFFALFNLVQDHEMPAAEFFIAGIACLTLVNSLDLAHINLYREVDEVFQKETNRRLNELSSKLKTRKKFLARPEDIMAVMANLTEDERRELEEADRSVVLPYMQEDPHEYGQVLHQQGETMPEWNELIKTVKHAWQYGIHCNDMTLGEIEEDISSALDRFAKANGLPEINWEEENDA